MKRRDFLKSAAAASVTPALLPDGTFAAMRNAHEDHVHGPGFANPAEAIASQREKLLYTVALYVGTETKKPDYLATIDVDPRSSTYSQVIHRLPMPFVGDELHHFGWNTCSSCHGDVHRERRYLIVPGLRSSRIHIVDAANSTSPEIVKVISPEEIRQKTNLSAPHTVHCLETGEIMISMLGDGDGNGPGGFLLLDEEFEIIGRWEKDAAAMKFNYDFWYQPRHNVMVSSEWSAPKTFSKGFDPNEVAAGNYGRQLHFWDFEARKIMKSVDLGDEGLIPLEVRFLHDPDSTHGYAGVALSSNVWHWQEAHGDWQVNKVIQVEPVSPGGGADPLPGLITDIVVSMDDRFVYFSNWLHGDLRQYDISDPANPKLAAQLWLGGLLGKAPTVRGKKLGGGPQMLQISLDGRRLYVTNSLYSSWDNQFYPDMAKEGSYLLQVDCDPMQGGMKLNEDFFVDFGDEPHGAARAHEMRYPGGDCTSDIFI